MVHVALLQMIYMCTYVTYCLYMLQAGAYNVFLEDTAPADDDEFSNATTEDEDVPEDEDEGEEAESEPAEPRPEVPEMEGARMEGDKVVLYGAACDAAYDQDILIGPNAPAGEGFSEELEDAAYEWVKR
jgi:hypothetical protein